MSAGSVQRGQAGVARDEIAVESVMRRGADTGDLRLALRTLAEEADGRQRQALAVAAWTAGEVVASVGLAVLAREVVDDAVAATGVAGTTVVVALVLAGVVFVMARARRASQERLIHALRTRGVERVARVIHGARHEDLTAVPMASLRELVMTDVDFAYRFFVDVLAQAVVVGFWLLATATLFAVLGPLVLMVLAVVAVVFALAFARGARHHLALTGARFVALADLSQVARDVVEVDRVLLARQLGFADRVVGAFMAAHERFVVVNLRQQELAATLRAAILSLNGLASILTVLVGGALIADERLDAGALVAMLFVLSQLLAAVAQSAEFAYRAAETAKAGRRLAAYWSRDDADPTPPLEPQPPAPVQRLEAVDVHHAYGTGPPVLAGIDVTLDRGRLAALTGATGSGKSTLALVLTGGMQPSRGHVQLDGHKDWSPAGLAAGRVLYVGTRPVLQAGSVLDNLMLERPPPAREVQALLAHVAPAVAERVDVTAPLVGPNGTGLSSGQGQVVQLLRAVVRDPEVLVLDEATSALDMASERHLQEALLEWVGRRICLVISHRTCPWTERALQHLDFGAAIGGMVDTSGRMATPGGRAAGSRRGAR